MEIEVCSSSEPETELGQWCSYISYCFWIDSGALLGLNYQENILCYPMNFSFQNASTMLNAFGFYYAQNYAGIIHQGLVRLGEVYVGTYLWLLCAVQHVWLLCIPNRTHISRYSKFNRARLFAELPARQLVTHEWFDPEFHSLQTNLRGFQV